MDVNTGSWIAVGFFLAVLIAVCKYQSRIKSESGVSWRHMSIGLALLSLSTVARLFHDLGLLARMPFFSEAVFFDLAYWILVISGGALLVNGVAEWLPLARMSRRLNQERIDRLELLHRVEQLVGVDNRLDMIMAHTLQYMKEQMPLGHGAAFKLSDTGGGMTVVAVADDFPVSGIELEEALRPAVRRSGDSKDVDPMGRILECLPAMLSRPSTIIPVKVAQQTVGFFGFWNQPQVINSDDRLLLQLAADVIGRKIQVDRLLQSTQAEEQRSNWLVSLHREVAEKDSPRQRIAALVRRLAEQCSFDSLALTMAPHKDAPRTRYSFGSSEQLLIQTNLPPVAAGAMTRPAIDTEQIIVFDNLPAEGQPHHSEIITNGLVRSLIAIPIRIHGEARAVLTLASRHPSAFDRSSASALMQARPAIVMALLPDILETVARRETSRLEELTQVVRFFGETNYPDEIVRTAACIIAEQTGADFVRVSTLDETGVFLESRAIISSVPTPACVPPDGKMVLSLMPRHREALQTSRSVVLSTQGRTAALGPTEARQVFVENLQWAGIVPLVAGGKSIGAMTLACTRAGSSLNCSSGSVVFSEAVAAILANKLVSIMPLSGEYEARPRVHFIESQRNLRPVASPTEPVH